MRDIRNPSLDLVEHLFGFQPKTAAILALLNIMLLAVTYRCIKSRAAIMKQWDINKNATCTGAGHENVPFL